MTLLGKNRKVKNVEKQKTLTSNEINNKYREFMCDPKNEFNCNECPDNKGIDSVNCNYPCGQQNCWVTCHCYPERFKM